MAKKYFTKNGFGGLSGKGKFIYVAVLVGVGLIGWLIFGAGSDNPLGALKAIGLAVVITWIIGMFLPRDTYYYTEYFCADCGQYLGYSPGSCDRCGCNRYTRSLSKFLFRKNVFQEIQQ